MPFHKYSHAERIPEAVGLWPEPRQEDCGASRSICEQMSEVVGLGKAKDVVAAIDMDDLTRRCRAVI